MGQRARQVNAQALSKLPFSKLPFSFSPTGSREVVYPEKRGGSVAEIKVSSLVAVSRSADAMGDAIRIAHPQIARCKKSFFLQLAVRKSLRLFWIDRIKAQSSRESPSMCLRCEKMTCLLRLSDAKCLRFGLSLRFGLRCECVRYQIASDSGRAVRTTKCRSMTRQRLPETTCHSA